MEPIEIFLCGVWTMVRDDEDTAWVKEIADSKPSRGLVSDHQEIIRRMLDAGVSERDIARLCRITGFETAQGILNMIDDPGAVYFEFKNHPRFKNDPRYKEAPELSWCIQVFDAAGADLGRLDGVHEEFESLDPTDREMGPPPD